MILIPELQAYVDTLLTEFDLIPQERKLQLKKFASYISQKLESGSPVQLTFICTHNSRRSLISQIWAAVAASYYSLDAIVTYSGGSETTAFNPRAVSGIQRCGFRIENPGGSNPHYSVFFSEAKPPVECFSKKYNDHFNPDSEFAAIMTCSHANENCPFIPGTEFRYPITYHDPKVSDGTPKEIEIYDERVRQIGREMFYAMRQVVDSNE